VPPTPEALRAALAALPLRVDDVDCARAAIALPSYPDEPRPQTIVTLAGGGLRGRGEHVGFTAAAPDEFAERARATAPFAGTVGAYAADVLAALPAHDRAALEAAAIDLALRQRGTTLFALAGVAPRPLRYVVSFGRTPDPAAAARAAGDVGLKVDVDPAWDDATLRALARAGRVEVLDWKGDGTRAGHERAHAVFPDALVEDPDPAAAPWSPSLARRLSADQRLLAPADVARLDVVAANLKPARLGGVLALLDTAAACAARGVAIYLGGMFELDVGRRQLHALAALLCPDAPNDVAPIPRDDRPLARPPRLVVDGTTPGFGV
jgi:hypothetical protein